MNSPTVQAALDKALSDMKELTPEQLRAELDAHSNGGFATALRETQVFLAEFEKSEKYPGPSIKRI